MLVAVSIVEEICSFHPRLGLRGEDLRLYLQMEFSEATGR